MKLYEIVEKIGLKVKAMEEKDVEIEKGYCCDLLSEVMGRAEAGCIWITVHTNMNVLGVASMLDIKAVIIAEGHEADDTFIEKAREEGIALFESSENGFTLSGKLYEMGIR